MRNVYPPPDAQLFGQVHYQLPFSFIDNRLVELAITSTVCFKVGSPAPPLPNKSVFSFFYVSTGNSAGIEGWEATEWHKFKRNPVWHSFGIFMIFFLKDGDFLKGCLKKIQMISLL